MPLYESICIITCGGSAAVLLGCSVAASVSAFGAMGLVDCSCIRLVGNFDTLSVDIECFISVDTGICGDVDGGADEEKKHDSGSSEGGGAKGTDDFMSSSCTGRQTVGNETSAVGSGQEKEKADGLFSKLDPAEWNRIISNPEHRESVVVLLLIEAAGSFDKEEAENPPAGSRNGGFN